MSTPGDASATGSLRLPAGRRLVLARHGQTPANVARVLDTVLPGPGLTDLGRAQAGALGRALAAGPALAGVHHSRARRAGETAVLAAAELGLAPQGVEGLQEVQVGALEGRSDDEAVEAFRTVVRAWEAGDTAVRFPGGESAEDLLVRWRAGLDTVLAGTPAGASVLVVGHGAALRIVGRALAGGVGVPPPESDHLDNCGRITLRERPGGWELESWAGAAPEGLHSAHDVTGG